MAQAIDRLVTIYGGSGFLGRHLVRALAKRGWRIRVAVRRPELANFLQPLGMVGQIHAVQANVRFPELVASAAEDADALVNLAGILFRSGRQTFEAVQAEGAHAVAETARSATQSSCMCRRSAPMQTRNPSMRAPRPRAKRR